MGGARIDDDTLIERDLESDSDSDSDDGESGGYKDPARAYGEERSKIDKHDAQRHQDGRSSQPFALAFSGGGIRAAAFQGGVLWRLAQADRLKDVEYFAAVSGGAYITAAFASHCVEAMEDAGLPEPGQVRDWYLQVVARTLCRMQDNAGNFVRDCVKEPGGPTNGNGLLPRIFDVPILLGMLLVTLMVSPLMLSCVIFILAFNLDIMWGVLMRIAFCSTDRTTWRTIFWRDENYRRLILAICVGLGVQLLFYIVRIVVPGFRLPPPKPGGGRPHPSSLYLFGHATAAMLARVVIALILFAILPVSVCIMERFEYDNAEGNSVQKSLCSGYWTEAVETKSRDFRYVEHLLETHDCTECAEHKHELCAIHWVCNLEWEGYAGPVPEETTGAPPRPFGGKLATFWLAILAGVAFLFVILPIIGVKFFVSVLAIAGPILFSFFVVQFSQIAVFTRITKNSRGSLAILQDDWDLIVQLAIWFFLLALPFYEKLRALFHIYYKRTLQSNFFARGRDFPVTKLLENPYIPFILLTGTSTDYQPPGDVDTISELSFSPLHCGSEETGYVGMPQEITLAKTAALSGAGCLDAVTLAMNSEKIFMRVYLEVLNLSWGDYIMFDPSAGAKAMQRRMLRACRESIGAFAWIVIFALQLLAYYLRNHPPFYAFWYALVSELLIVITISLSFYNFVPTLDTITLSSLVRLFHQTTSYFYVGVRPPPMLYVTDGGVRDCTAICQLLWRKCERILLVLAAGDPEDDLNVLRTAMDVALELKLAHFYDADDATKSLNLTFEEYKKDVNKPFLHLGVSYCFDKEPKHGHLIVVKNRLPDSQKDKPVKPLLTEEEIITGEEPDESDSDLEAFNGMNSSELGSLGCCDCCHAHGLNCGAKFPHGTGANYLYLTPQFCNSLMRLGHDISGQAVDVITSPSLCTQGPKVRS